MRCALSFFELLSKRIQLYYGHNYVSYAMLVLIERTQIELRWPLNYSKMGLAILIQHRSLNIALAVLIWPLY